MVHHIEAIEKTQTSDEMLDPTGHFSIAVSRKGYAEQKACRQESLNRKLRKKEKYHEELQLYEIINHVVGLLLDDLKEKSTRKKSKVNSLTSTEARPILQDFIVLPAVK